jgi:hypothetical protein
LSNSKTVVPGKYIAGLRKRVECCLTVLITLTAGLPPISQLMETENPTLFRKWTERWKDLVEFEVIQVVSSEEANKAILNPV